MKIYQLLSVAAILMLSGCAYVPPTAQEAEERIRTEAVDSAVHYLCKRIRMTDWQRTFGQDRTRIAAWAAMCVETDAPPPGLPLPRPAPDDEITS